MFKNCCFVIHGALWTLALYGPIFGQGEDYYIRSYYYILYPCSPLILTFLIYLIFVSVFALTHRLHSYKFVCFSLRINVTILLLAVFLPLRLPRDVCSFSETIYYFIEGWPAWKRLVISLLQVSFAFL